MSEEMYERGLAIRRAVLGDEHVERSLQNTDDFTRDFQHFITDYCWGGCWGRDTLPRPTRSLVTLAILGALGRWEEFELHFRGAIRNGCTQEELKDLLYHITVYSGVPAGVAAFRVASRVLQSDEIRSDNKP
jgi:4-carboxymuconolactone decarboxylase